MNIAIVDDDSIELHAAKKYLSDYLQNNWSQIDFNIQIFSSAKDFFNIFSVGAFQLVILNISMPEIDGLQAARIIRTRGDDDVNIVFLTNNDNFVLSGCKVFAVGYFLKHISRHKDDFNKTFEYILPKINKKSPEITLTVDNVQFNVRMLNICAILPINNHFQYIFSKIFPFSWLKSTNASYFLAKISKELIPSP